MRKNISMLLLVCLLLSQVAGTVAMAEQTQNLDPVLNDIYINGLLLHQGKLLLHGTRGPKQVDLVTGVISDYEGISDDIWLQQAVGLRDAMLMSDGNTLYALSMQDVALYPLSIENGKISQGQGLKLDLSSQAQEFDMGDETHMYYNRPEQAIISGGRLYLLFKNYDYQGQQKNGLLSFDIITGAAAIHDIPHLQSFTPYKDGKFLAVIMNMEEAWDSVNQVQRNTSLAVVDMASNSVTTLGSSGLPFGNMQPLAYDPGSDSIYLVGKAEIHRWEGDGKTRVCAYLSSSQLWGIATGQVILLPDGRLSVAGSEVLNIRGLDPDKLPAGRLTIYGGWESQTHRKAILSLPGVPVRFLEEKWFPTAQELGQAMISGEDNIDILRIFSANIDFPTILRKGYALNLSDSTKLADFVASCYPMMQEVVKQEGNIYAIPIEGTITRYSYDVFNFKKIGLEPPRTFKEFCQILGDWEEKYAADYPAIRPIGSDDLFGELVTLAFNLYANEAARRGEAFDFRSPLLRSLLEEAEAVKPRLSPPDPNREMMNGGMVVIGGEEGSNTLFEAWGSNDLRNMGRPTQATNWRPVELLAEEGGQLSLPMNLQLMFVNPNSKNKESAIRYLEAYAGALSGAERIMLIPSENAPVENPNYQTLLKEIDEVIKDLKKQVEQAEGAEKTQLQGYLAEYEKNKDQYEQELRYEVTPEGIVEYREMMNHVYIRQTSVDTAALDNPDIHKVLLRYRQGELSLDQMLTEAENKLRLMILESQ